MFKVIATSKIIAQAQYVLKIVFVFVAVLFVDGERLVTAACVWA